MNMFVLQPLPLAQTGREQPRCQLLLAISQVGTMEILLGMQVEQTGLQSEYFLEIKFRVVFYVSFISF